MDQVTVDLSVCVRCAACAILAPGTFEVTRKGVRVLVQPQTPAERTAARAAAATCPMQAIRQVVVP